LAITALFIDEYYGRIAEKLIKARNLLPEDQINIHAEYFNNCSKEFS